MPKKFADVWTDKIVAMTKEGHSVPVIQKWLKSNGVNMSKPSVWYYAKGLQKPRRTKTTPEIAKLVEEITRENVDLYAKQIKTILKNQHNIDISETSIRVIRRQLRGIVEHNKTMPEDMALNDQNMYSTPNTSNRRPNYNASTGVLASHNLHCCISSIVEEAVKNALSSVNQVVEDAVKKAVCQMMVKPVASDYVNSVPSIIPLWDAEHVDAPPSVYQLPHGYNNDPRTSTTSSDYRLNHIVTTNEVVRTDPLTVVPPISNFTLRALDSTKVNNFKKMACNEPHRFAQLLFKELVPYDVYKTWIHRVNYDGSRGKQALPENLRNAIIKETEKRYIITTDIAKKIKETLNALLRMPRASRW